MSNNTNDNAAAGSFTAADILHPVALANKLQAADHPFSRMLANKFSPAGQEALATPANGAANPAALAPVIAKELNVIVTSGLSLYDPARVNGTKLRNSTIRLIKTNPQGAKLERLNTLLVQDFFPEELDHDSCELVDAVKKKKIEFSIYKFRRRLKKKWNIYFKITYPATNGLASAHARSLEDAYAQLDTLAERVLAGQAPVTKKENKDRDAKAADYDEMAADAAKAGKTEPKEVKEFVRDAVKAQMAIGLTRPLLEFVLYAVEVLVKPVTRCLLQPAAALFSVFLLARKDVDKGENRRHSALVKRFAAAMPALVHQRNLAALPPGSATPEPPKDVFVDEPKPNEIQGWLNGLKKGWVSRRGDLDRVRAFLAYCRDALHALPPGLKTAAHIVPRIKPDSDMEPVPAPVLSFTNVWRILLNLQDLETLWFFAMGVFAGLHQTEMRRLVWENDIIWEGNRPVQIFIASGKGKDKHGHRMGHFVDIRTPLSKILALGRGRTGKITRRKTLRGRQLGRLARRLNIAWDQSIMRHTFASNLFGLGYSFEQVARQLRNTIDVLKRHYYAPIPKCEAKKLFSLPADPGFSESTPFQMRFWNWKAPLKNLIAVGTSFEVVTEPLIPASCAEQEKRTRVRRKTPIAWPEDPELLVMLWDKPQSETAQELKCFPQTVSSHAAARRLKVPPRGHWEMLKLGLPVEIPKAVLQAREELLARKNAAAAKAREDSAAPPSTQSATEDHPQKPPATPANPEPGDRVNPSQPHDQQTGSITL